MLSAENDPLGPLPPGWGKLISCGFQKVAVTEIWNAVVVQWIFLFFSLRKESGFK